MIKSIAGKALAKFESKANKKDHFGIRSVDFKVTDPSIKKQFRRGSLFYDNSYFMIINNPETTVGGAIVIVNLGPNGAKSVIDSPEPEKLLQDFKSKWRSKAPSIEVYKSEAEFGEKKFIKKSYQKTTQFVTNILDR